MRLLIPLLLGCVVGTGLALWLRHGRTAAQRYLSAVGLAVLGIVLLCLGTGYALRLAGIFSLGAVALGTAIAIAYLCVKGKGRPGTLHRRDRPSARRDAIDIEAEEIHDEVR